MTTKPHTGRWFAALLVLCFLAACGNQKGPAEKAIAEAEGAIAAVRDDASKYAPDELKAVDDELAGLKDSLARSDYKAVTDGSKDLHDKIASLGDTIKAKQAEAQAHEAQLADQWNVLSTEVPEIVEAVQARVESLGRTHKYPAGMDEKAFAGVKAEADDMAKSWQQALGAFANSNMQEAVDMAQTAKTKGTEVKTALGITSSG